MITVTVDEAEVVQDDPLYLIGLEGEGTEFVFQCDVRRNQYDAEGNWAEGDSYCVTNEAGQTSYGSVRKVELSERSLKITFSEKALRCMGLVDQEMEFKLDSSQLDFVDLARACRVIFTCGRPEYHPRMTGF